MARVGVDQEHVQPAVAPRRRLEPGVVLDMDARVAAAVLAVAEAVLLAVVEPVLREVERLQDHRRVLDHVAVVARIELGAGDRRPAGDRELGQELAVVEAREGRVVGFELAPVAARELVGGLAESVAELTQGARRARILGELGGIVGQVAEHRGEVAARRLADCLEMIDRARGEHVSRRDVGRGAHRGGEECGDQRQTPCSGATGLGRVLAPRGDHLLLRGGDRLRLCHHCPTPPH